MSGPRMRPKVNRKSKFNTKDIRGALAYLCDLVCTMRVRVTGPSKFEEIDHQCATWWAIRTWIVSVVLSMYHPAGAKTDICRWLRGGPRQ